MTLAHPPGGDPAPLPDRAAQPNLSSYEEERATYRVQLPDTYNPVIDIVERWAGEAGDELALETLDGAGELVARHTAADLARDARRFASALAGLGVGKGDTILIVLPRIPQWYAAMLGVIRLGAIASPGTGQLTSRDLSYRARSAGAKVVITDAAGAAKVDAIDEELPSVSHRIAIGNAGGSWLDFDRLMADASDEGLPATTTSKDDPVLLFFTSGTVSYPKRVLHAASYGHGHVSTARFWHDLRPGDRHWTVSDTGWAKAAWGGLFGQFHERATVVQVALGKPVADEILSIVSRAQITSFCAPPTLYRLLVQTDLTKHDLSRLRHCTSAGEPLNPEVIRAWAEGTGGLTIYDGYGQSETTVLVANYRSVSVRPGSMGKPVPGWDVEVVDDSGEPAANDTVGNIAVKVTDPRPVGLFLEYSGDADANTHSFRDGWYYTGDKAWRDQEGYIWFEGRDDDVITSSAYRIGPFEVESALIEHPAVAEAAVVGKDDPARTQIVTAFCVLTAGHEPGDELVRELQQHTQALTAPYKYPREIHFVTELPKTVSGKIRRSELREKLRAGEFG